MTSSNLKFSHFVLALFYYSIHSGSGNSLQIKISYPRSSQLIFGANVSQHQYPFMVNIQFIDRRVYPFCAGTILDPEMILTAAHCFFKDDSNKCPDGHPKCYRVVAGTDILSEDQSPAQTQQFSIASVHKHQAFDKHTYENDLAIIRLETPLNFTDGVQPIAIIEQGNQYNTSDAMILGWGRSAFNEIENTLQFAKVVIFPNETCTNRWQDDFRPGLMLCAGGNVTGAPLVADACYGDSGGPLVSSDIGNAENKFVVGIISSGYDCGLPAYPGLYTRLENYLDWIRTMRDQLKSTGN